MTIEDDIAFLGRIPALAILGPDALRILAIGSENRYVHEGVALLRGREGGRRLYGRKARSIQCRAKQLGSGDRGAGR